jgi:ParB family chromosome partitioning protein
MSDFEPGQITSVSPDKLKPHPKNEEIYFVDRLDELTEKIKEHGFLDEHRIITTTNGKILSGHRRWKAAKELNLNTVPIEAIGCEDECEELRRILIANKYREKTPGEIRKEKNAWKEIEAEKAKQRQKEAGENYGKSNAKGEQDVAQSNGGKTRDKVGEKIGVSGETVRRIDKIEEEAESGNKVAQEQLDKLDSGDQSITGAYQEVKQAGRETNNTKETTTTDKDTVKAETRNRVVTVELKPQAYVLQFGNSEYEISESLFDELFTKK